MRLIVRRRQDPPALQLLELVTPRTNEAIIAPVENLLAGPLPGGRCSLEIAITPDRRRFLARAGGDTLAGHLEDLFGGAYPQATLRRLAGDVDDPARRAPGERVAACTLRLRDDDCLPLKLFRDLDLDDERAAQADPILGVLAAAGRLPAGWRALCQVVVGPAPRGWHRPYRRKAVEHPLGEEHSRARPASRQDHGAGSENAALFLAVLAGLALLAWHARGWYRAGDWGRLGLLALAAGAGLPLLLALARWWNGRRQVYDNALVAEKLAHVARAAEVRLAVFAPAGTTEASLRARLDRFAGAYGQYARADGNAFVPRPLRGAAARDLRRLEPLDGRPPVLNARELAALWHLPQALADVAGVERTTARQVQPLAHTVARGCHIGESARQGRAVPVHLPEDLLASHLLLIAKTRRGKSSLLLTVARHLMARPPRRPPGPARPRLGQRPAVGAPAGVRPALLLVDPHSDLARAALGIVPPAGRERVVFLDAGHPERPFGLNLLDTGLGWSRDQAVASCLTIFQREFDQNWGPRMEDAFRFVALTLYEANEAICAADPEGGRDRQHTILDIPTVFTNGPFRQRLIDLTRDPAIRAWWEDYFLPLDPRTRLEIANPVLTKVNRFAGAWAPRLVVGQPRSTIDPRAWLRDGALVIVDVAKGRIGENAAALLGATLVNLAGLAVGAQVALEPAARVPLTMIVDECHTMPGIDFEAVLAEYAKYGGNLVLASQSLGRLDALDAAGERGLRATLFANLDGLFAFNTSADDARALVPELGGPFDEQDLVELPHHACYVRMTSDGVRLPTFSVDLAPPPRGDEALAAALAAASAARWGRPVAAVTAMLAAARERIAAMVAYDYPRTVEARGGEGLPAEYRALASGDGGPGYLPGAGGGATRVAAAGGGKGKGKGAPGRNEHRRRQPAGAAPEQTRLFPGPPAP